LDLESDFSRLLPDADHWKELEIESNVTLSSKPRDAQLKVDDPTYRLDFTYWVQLLQFQARNYGRKGIQKIWNGMMERKIDLPTTGTVADILWGTFVKDIDLVQDVLENASDLKTRTGRAYDGLYATCIGHWLPRHPTTAYKSHLFLVEHLNPTTRSLREIARSVKFTQTSLNTFKTIYLESNERDVYGTLIPMLYPVNKPRAQEWHSFFLEHNDLPSVSLAASPMVTELSTYHTIPSQNTRKPRSDSQHLVMRPDVVPRDKPEFNREIMSRMLGESHHVKPKKEFEDAFCARLFATRAFSPTSVIKGLGMFGIELIGPLALREMGLRTEPFDEMPRRFKELKDAGISIGKSVFSKAIEKFTADNRLDMVRELLESDQHPDVLEDTKVQEELLTFFISKEDWRQVHRTLAILTVFHTNPEVESWNLLLRAHSKSSSGFQVNQVLEDMHSNGVEVTHESLNSLHRNILRHRSPSKRPIFRYGDHFDDIRFLAKIWLRIMENGGNIPPWRWHEILRRFGMTGRLRELRRLLMWLAAWYHPWKAASTQSAFRFPATLSKSTNLENTKPRPLSETAHSNHIPPSHPKHPLAQLVPPNLQIALIEWGFKAGLAPNAKLERSLYLRSGRNFHTHKTRVSWTTGLQTLATLRDSGIRVKDSTVRKAIKTRLTVLYGPGVSNRKENRVAKRTNPYTFMEIIKVAEEVWGRRLFHWQGREEEGVVGWKKEGSGDGMPEREKQVLRRQRIGMVELRRYLRL
jgi:hypothetical protein